MTGFLSSLHGFLFYLTPPPPLSSDITANGRGVTEEVRGGRGGRRTGCETVSHNFKETVLILVTNTDQRTYIKGLIRLTSKAYNTSV